MNFRHEPSYLAVETTDFDLMRAKLEFVLPAPAVIAISACTAEDGKEIAAWGLANSLATTGYATLFLDTSLAGRGRTKPTQRLTIEEAGHLLTPDPGAKLAVLNLGDLLMQKRTSQRHIQSALEVLRRKFDYVVINTQCGGLTAFSASVLGTADAVLVTVKTGRRQTADDSRLSATLEHIGPRFLGVVALDPTIIKGEPAITPAPDTIPDWRLGQTAQDKEHQRREIVEWPN